MYCFNIINSSVKIFASVSQANVNAITHRRCHTFESFSSLTFYQTVLRLMKLLTWLRRSFTLNVIVLLFVCLASRIRGKVAQVPFDEFHRYSTSVIKKAVFGVDKDGKIKQRLRFDANQLVSNVKHLGRPSNQNMRIASRKRTECHKWTWVGFSKIRNLCICGRRFFLRTR